MLEIKESNPIKIGKLTKTIIDIKKTGFKRFRDR